MTAFYCTISSLLIEGLPEQFLIELTILIITFKVAPFYVVTGAVLCEARKKEP